MIVNGKQVKEDGDWFGCPECDEFDCPLLNWFRYCPICGMKIDIVEEGADL